MNKLAKALNDDIININPSIYEMLSDLGRDMYMPTGIVTQGNEATAKAKRFNATIGIATSKNKPLYLDSMYKNFSNLDTNEVFPYAPTSGLLKLREVWQAKIIRENPILKNKHISMPIITAALTHGISLISELFCNKGDRVILSDMYWGNYTLTFGVKLKADIVMYKTFDNTNTGYNVTGLLDSVKTAINEKGKAILILNFPNNPTGYTPSTDEMNAIVDGLVGIAASGGKIVVVIDDAYFGLFHTANCATESIFSSLANRSKNLLAIKLDAATKEAFVWGFRIGFATFGGSSELDIDETKLLKALETKLTGLIRATVSNASHPAQSIILKALQSNEFIAERTACNTILKERAIKVIDILSTGKYNDQFIPYPFNSGYFMCIKLHNVNAETLRIYLLDKYSIGVISTSDTDIRIAFSSVDIDQLTELFDIIYQACKEI